MRSCRYLVIFITKHILDGNNHPMQFSRRIAGNTPGIKLLCSGKRLCRIDFNKGVKAFFNLDLLQKKRNGFCAGCSAVA